MTLGTFGTALALAGALGLASGAAPVAGQEAKKIDCKG